MKNIYIQYSLYRDRSLTIYWYMSNKILIQIGFFYISGIPDSILIQFSVSDKE